MADPEEPWIVVYYKNGESYENISVDDYAHYLMRELKPAHPDGYYVQVGEPMTEKETVALLKLLRSAQKGS